MSRNLAPQLKRTQPEEEKPPEQTNRQTRNSYVSSESKRGDLIAAWPSTP